MSVLDALEARQYLSFGVAGDLFAADVGRVREILEMVPITRLPGTPDHVRGVINVRGSVVPVVDMRKKFGLPERDNTIDTCIVVMEVEAGDQPVILGAIVDSVEEVFDLAAAEVEPAPRMGTNVDVAFIHGIGKHGDGFVIILDIDRVFSGAELEDAPESEGAGTSAETIA